MNMKALSKSTIMLLLAATVVCVFGCTKPNDNNNSNGNPDNDVIVTTYTPADITASTVVSGCSVQVRQGLSLTKIGICYSTSANPTAEDSQLSSDAWNEPFVKTLTGLSPNTTYHVRAFALRGLEYYYGEDKAFTTLADNGGGGNGGGSNNPTLPTVTTSQITDITQNTAQCGGNVTNDGGATVMERGICWGTNHEPNTSGSHIANGNGTGSYTVLMTGLTPGMVYYVRAYAINSQGTNYGDETYFTTLSGGGGNGGGYGPPPTGAINGVFSVSPTKQVWFSQGNLQYNAAQGSHQCSDGTTKQGTWRFAEKQWHYVGGSYYGNTAGNVYDNGVQSSNNKISANYFGWIDLFGWGTSGYHDSKDPYNVNYLPWSISNEIIKENTNYFGYGPSINMFSPDLTGSSANYDWGVYNPINNGGDTFYQWRTLTRDEWVYVFDTRQTSTVNGTPNARYAKAKVNNVQGVVLFPDNYTHPSGVLQPVGINDPANTGWDENNYGVSDFELMEQHGAVFFPVTGSRKGTSVGGFGINGNPNSTGNYWTSFSGCSSGFTASNGAFQVFFDKGHLILSEHMNRYFGRSVRLVHDVQ